jgi:signal transduction histidine kinase
MAYRADVGSSDDPKRLRWGWPAELAMVVVVGVGQTLATAHAARHHGGDVKSLDGLGYLMLAATAALLPLRRRWPIAALVSIFAVTLGYALLNYPGGPVWAPLIIAFGTVLIAGHRVAAYLSLIVGYPAFMWLPDAVNDRSAPPLSAVIGLAAWLLLLAAIGELVRNRRTVQQVRRERALEARHSHDEQVRRQASEERLRIARELHDVLAHSISMINVQAGVGLELLDTRPEQARSALGAIKEASKDALVEVQAVLGSLRQAGEHEPRTPVPRLTEVANLARGAEAAGLTVRVHTVGQPVPLPAGVDLAGYRIVQEALTNVVRHAGATTATVRLDYRPGELGVQVDDDGRGTADGATANGGNGIAGMRERADALGGRLSAGPGPGGGFRVSATLPFALPSEGRP